MATSASLSPRLLLELLKLPAWRAGIAANVAAYALQFLALRRGSLVLVQPLLVSGLLLALLLGEVLAPGTLGRRELLAALAIAVGLSLFLVAASPNRGAAHTSATTARPTAAASRAHAAAGAVAAPRFGDAATRNSERPTAIASAASSSRRPSVPGASTSPRSSARSRPLTSRGCTRTREPRRRARNWRAYAATLAAMPA